MKTYDLGKQLQLKALLTVLIVVTHPDNGICDEKRVVYMKHIFQLKMCALRNGSYENTYSAS